MSRASEFFRELYRRRVVGTVMIYMAGAWVAIEMISVMVPVFGGPDWLVRSGIAVVLLGLPVAVVVSWWFDFNPRTLRLDAYVVPETASDAAASPAATRVAEDDAPVLPGPRSRYRAPVAVAGLFALLLTGFLIIPWGSQPVSLEMPGVPTIAVLPFVDTSPHADNEYLADGLTDELINTLAQLDGLRVAARTSSFTYKATDTPVRQIADELGVGVVLAGSIRQDGDQLRIHAQLVNAADGYNLWARSYERTKQDLFTVQAEIVRAVMEQLRTGTSHSTVDLARGRTDDVDAYHHYLRGRYHWHRRDDPQRREEHLRNSLDSYERALAADPTLALAWAGLADTHASLAGSDRSGESYARAKAAALQAVKYDETLAEGHVALARILVFREWDWAGAGKAYRRAIELSPSYATAHQWYGMYLLHTGQGDAALREIGLAQRLDPLSISVKLDAGRVLYFTRRYDEAIVQWQHVLALDPNSADARLHLGLTYVEKGMFQEAQAEFEHWARLRREAPTALLAYTRAAAGDLPGARRLLYGLLYEAQQQRAPAAAIALIYARLGDRDNAFLWLGRAVEARSSFLLFIKVSPRMDPLRTDPRYRELLHRIGLDL
jgi:eukaryotic-like serine/threonine-protein kinase